MGVGACDTVGRILASLGLAPAEKIAFEPSRDVTNGGVLFALPALLASGLLKHTEKLFQLPAGFYYLRTLFLLLAFMALTRLKNLESLRYSAPGEWGKLLGIDRAPEVKTLREKVQILSKEPGASEWSALLCKEWMESDSEASGTFYIDGHVRVYHGDQVKLPRHYVARERLCLRATTDYWVNAMDGQPFFCVTKAVDPGLIQVLRETIVPRLEKDLPPVDEEALSTNSLTHRLTLVFDREGYSPAFFSEMKLKQIACLTYHKHPTEDWSADEFTNSSVRLASGETLSMEIAERGTQLSNGLWVREIRKQNKSGHQTSILATDYTSDLTRIAAAMFARWSQENFFKYMREHFSLDRLIDYQTDSILDTERVVNPDYRALDSALRSKTALLSRVLAKFGAVTLQGEIDGQKIRNYQNEKAALQEEISALQAQIEPLKSKRKETKRHIPFSQLKEEDRFSRLSSHGKHFIDTIKMIAYRAETAMSFVLKEALSRKDESRRLLRSIYTTEADLFPNEKEKTLTVRLHHLANKNEDVAVRYLCAELNETRTVFPGTDLSMIFELL